MNVNDYFQSYGYQCYSCQKTFGIFKSLKIHIQKSSTCKRNSFNQTLLDAGNDFRIQEHVNASTHVTTNTNIMDSSSGTQNIWMRNFLRSDPNRQKRAKTSNNMHSVSFDSQQYNDPSPVHENTNTHQKECPDEGGNGNRNELRTKSNRIIRKPIFFDDSDAESDCLDVVDQSMTSPENVDLDDVDFVHEETIPVHEFQISKELIELDQSIYKSMNFGIVDNKLVALSKLEKILRKCNAPLFLFYEIQDYIHRYSHLFTDTEVMSRKSFYHNISLAIYGKEFARFKPDTHILKLPSEELVDIVYYDFTAQVYSILSDRKITNYENTIFRYINAPCNHAKDPFHIPHTWKATDGVYKDIETTVHYRMLVVQQLNRLAQYFGISFEEAKKKFIICPLPFFTDGTLITRSLSSGLEPVNFTLGILNQATRNKHEAWRLLTVIPAINSSLSPKEKLEDYHAILSFVIGAITKKIENQSFAWTLFDKNGDALPERNLIFSPYCFAGDSAGHAKLCGKFNNFSRLKHISRDCDCLTEDADNVDVQCNMLFHDDMMKKTEKELKSLSFYKVENFAFKQNIFACNPLGIWGSTPPEPLHLLFGGLVDYIYKAFYDKLYTQQKKVLDKCVMRLAALHYRHTCKDDFPRMSLFKKGIELKGTIAAKDKVARIFMLYLVSTCEEWRKYIVGSKWKQFLEGEEELDDEPTCDDETHDEPSNREEVSSTTEKRTSRKKKSTRKSKPVEVTLEMYMDWTRLFENTFIICKWITYETKKRVDFVGRRESIAYKCVQRYLRSVANIVKRDKAGLKLLKFHHVLHLPSYMPFITMASVNTCIHENHHISKVKHTGRNTQQRSSTIRTQTMQRVFESDCLDRFISLYSEEERVPTTRPLVGKHTFELRFNYETETADFVWMDKRKNGNTEPPSELLKSVFNKFNSYNGGTPYARLHSIRGFTTIKAPNRDYNRPMRAIENLYGDSWFDWVEVTWTEDIGILPARIYMILDFREPSISQIAFHNNIPSASQIASQPRNDIQLLIHSAKKERLRSNTYILRHAQLSLVRQFEMESTLQWVSFDNVLQPAFVYQDWDRKFIDRDKKIPSFLQRPNYNDCMLLPHDIDWHERFMQAMTKDYDVGTNSSGKRLEESRNQKENEFCDMEPNYNHFFQ